MLPISNALCCWCAVVSFSLSFSLYRSFLFFHFCFGWPSPSLHLVCMAQKCVETIKAHNFSWVEKVLCVLKLLQLQQAPPLIKINLMVIVWATHTQVKEAIASKEQIDWRVLFAKLLSAIRLYGMILCVPTFKLEKESESLCDRVWKWPKIIE